MDSLNKEYGIPAADCKITKGHEVIYRHMVGYADYEKNKPITEQTCFRFFFGYKVDYDDSRDAADRTGKSGAV